MANIVLREYRDFTRGRGGVGPSVLIKGELITDGAGKGIKTVTTSPGVAVDSVPMSAKTWLVAIEPEVNIRYAVRPKKNRWVSLPATAQHNPVAGGTVAYEAVYPGAIISFFEPAASQSLPGTQPFLPGYVPILAL